MKYLVIMALLMGGLTNYVDAQESLPTLDWGSIKPKKPRYISRSNERLAGEVNGELFTYDYKYNPNTSTLPPIKLFLTKYDTDLAWEKVETLNLTINRYLVNDPVVKAIGDQLYLFGFIWDQEIMEHIYVAQQIDPEKMAYSGPLQRIMGISGPSESFRKGEFDVVYSTNRKRILFYGRTRYKESPNQHHFKVYDQEMNLLWELDKDFGQDYKGLRTFMPNLKVSNHGDVAMLSFFTDETEKLYCLQISEEGNEMLEQEIAGDWKRCLQVQLAHKPSGDLVVGGFFERSAMENSGAFIQEISASGDKEAIRYYTFSDPAFTPFRDESTWTMPARPFANDLLLQQDGNILLITMLESPEGYQINPASSSLSTTRLADIILTSLSPTEDVNWSVLIPRLSIPFSKVPEQLYYSIILPDRICFITDHIEPEARDLGSAYIKNAHRSINLSSVGTNGKLETQVLFDFPGEGAFIQPLIGYEQSNRRLLLRVVKGKNGHWARLRF